MSMQDDDYGSRAKKGESLRGGSKKKRDKWYGYDDQDFQRWWHRQGKREFGGKDLENAEEVKEVYEDWISRGKPKAK